MAQLRLQNCKFALMNFKRYTALLFTTVAVLLLSAVSVMAQPGGGGDPLPCDPDDTTCPIDSGVWVLVVALVFTAFYLQRKQKAAI